MISLKGLTLKFAEKLPEGAKSDERCDFDVINVIYNFCCKIK